MHMLCLITYKVRSENGYVFLRPGLKTGMGNGIFWSEIGSGFGDAGGAPPPKFPRSTPPGLITSPPDKHHSLRLWRWLPLRISKRQSPTIVLFRTNLTRTTTLCELLDIYVICRLGGPYSEKLWPRSWKCCPGPQAEGSIFKSEVTVFHYTDRP